MLENMGPNGYPVKPWSPGESIFEQASAAMQREHQRHEQEEKQEAAGTMPMGMAIDNQRWKDLATISEMYETLADPFHCDPDDYHPKGGK